MERNDRDGRDAAGIGPYAREREHLTPLSSLESWRVSDGEPDVRGWEIRTVSNRQIGTVADLLIDREAGEVVMIDVDLPGSDRHTFVPIRVVQVDRERRVILMDSADLPESDVVRDERVSKRTPAPPGTVRYPASDREIVSDRTILADAPQRDDLLAAREPSADEPLVDRRQGDRRKIDRLSTDL